MSLMKLLAVSRSFAGGRNEPGRYKMVEQSLLPKFAPVGRPISLAPKRKREETPAERNSRQGQPDATVSHHESIAARPESNRGAALPLVGSTTESDMMVAQGLQATICANAIPASTNWFRMQGNPFFNRPAGKVEPKIQVQAELSLDAVKPVRNDLSDADLEVVPTEPGIEQSGLRKPPRLRWFKSELARFAWSRLTARLFNSERVRA